MAAFTEIKATFKATIDGETHWVECRSWDDGDRFHTIDYVALAKVGRTGSKLWPSQVWFFRTPNGSYKQGVFAVHLNRQAFIVTWNKAKFAGHLSQHNSSSLWGKGLA